ncbi:TetR/AcrR family transcriptional regulator [Devosia rhizoryzae]|uniref:TetR/AcrR family transcriptional regulator n=1 Tax=Devosia rhizoryzae TaxID=2774137 RepID=A0ABX7C3I3_9HYPH|nr:TetR/AcrR family transcriptional regulator [Devosia rhizoryzae]QQR38797.1 TetR/AcrR family transcriptional regulator [Devosia rhizoryzae]
MQEEKRTQEERREATKAALLSAARKLFADKGYAATATPEIVAEAGVTRGALYHHFADKLALFEAVVEEEHRAVAEAITAVCDGAAAPPDMIDALVAGGEGFLAAMQDEGRRRIMLIDAPAVISREALDRINQRYGQRTLVEGVQCAVDAGVIGDVAVEPTAQLLGALFDRAALAPSGELDAYRQSMERVIRGLRK